jgi:MYXO-CTERM domain-containing protein
MDADYAPIILPICAAVVVVALAWLVWLRRRRDKR